MGHPKLVLVQHHRLRPVCEVDRIGALQRRSVHPVHPVAAPVGNGKVASVEHDGVAGRGKSGGAPHRGESGVLKDFNGGGSVQHHINAVRICGERIAQVAQAAAVDRRKSVGGYAVVARPVRQGGGSTHEGAFVEDVQAGLKGSGSCLGVAGDQCSQAAQGGNEFAHY